MTVFRFKITEFGTWGCAELHNLNLSCVLNCTIRAAVASIDRNRDVETLSLLAGDHS